MQLQTDSDTRLKIYSPEKELQYNEKLISGLLAENPDIDFNSDHDFTIEITFDSYYVPVSIRINDWEIIIEEAVLPFFSPIKYCLSNGCPAGTNGDRTPRFFAIRSFALPFRSVCWVKK